MQIKFITQQRLLKVFSYDPETGVLVKVRAIRHSEIDVPCNGKKVGIDGYRPPSSHIIWKMMTGEDVPDGWEVDHEDRDHSNDKWDNLRLATRQQNNHNTGVRHHNLAGIKGVRTSVERVKGRFTAYIMSDGVGRYLGRYDTAEEAAAAYEKAARELHGNFACPDRR